MGALTGNQLCYLACSQSIKSIKSITEMLNVGTPRESTLLPGSLSKRVKHDRNVECRRSQGINVVARHPLQECATHRNVECGHSQGINVVVRQPQTGVKHYRNVEVSTPGESTLLPGMLSKRVKQNRGITCGHSQGINFVTRHPIKECKT